MRHPHWDFGTLNYGKSDNWDMTVTRPYLVFLVEHEQWLKLDQIASLFEISRKDLIDYTRERVWGGDDEKS